MLEQLAAEFKASARLRIGLGLAVAVLWVNGLLSLRDTLDEAIKRHAQLTGQINRARQYAAQTDWPERAKQAQMAQVQMESRLWHSGTPGLAQAAFQDWLAQSLSKSAPGRQEITLIQDGGANPSAPSNNLWKIKAKLSFDFTPQSFNEWMSALSSSERQVSIEKLTVRMVPTPRIEAILAAPFQKNAP